MLDDSTRPFKTDFGLKQLELLCSLKILDCNNKKGITCYKVFHGEDDKTFPYLQKFREVGLAKLADKIQAKLKNQAKEVLYLGHAEDHSNETVRLLKLSTKRVV